MLTHEETLLFFRRKPALSVSAIEKQAGLPSGTLAKAISGDRTLNDKHLAALYPVLLEYGYAEMAERKARIISVVNHKGGVGKTTTTLNLGKALSLAGFRVLLVDMDSQGNLTQSLGQDELDKQVVHALLKNEPLPIIPIAKNLDLAPSDLELAYADLELVQVVGGVNQLKMHWLRFAGTMISFLLTVPPL
ncbi:ParA family protein [Siphonobacter sp. BAB-5385]|uniref:ParA family protein n=1 Tax=Siphonobacter sp. BAB-5385 TaxID=1864822 RepID=UPI0026C7A8FC